MDNSERFNSLANELQLRSKQEDLFAFDENKGLELVFNSRNVFSSKVTEAKMCALDKNYEMASRHAFDAANYAVSHHPGFFTSPELEELLIECGKNLPSLNMSVELPRTKDVRKVFHILSEGYSIGGHTRLVKNWIERDKDSIHYVITTWQINSTPNWLIQAVINSGGVCIPLDRSAGSFLARAWVLREITKRYADVVVCHIHMNDPIPNMAFSIQEGPPVIFLNHADHLFWLGASIADIVFDIRPSGQKLTLKRRNVKASYLLPIPLIKPQEVIAKDLARRDLGLPLDAVVLLSIATRGKFDSFNQNDFINFLKRILENNSNTIAVIVGPPNEGKWQRAFIETNGRIKAVGVQQEIEKYYSSADIYLDSYMFSSITSGLDAGLRGLPLAALKNMNNEVLSFDDISLENLDNQFTSKSDYFGYIDELIKNKELRLYEGSILSDNVKKHHVDLWKNHLSKGYGLAERSGHTVSLPEFQDTLGTEDIFLALFQELDRKKK